MNYLFKIDVLHVDVLSVFVRKNKGDNNMSDRNLINRAIFEVKANIRELEAALETNKQKLKALMTPSWRSDSKQTEMPISTMNSRHLLAAARLCITRRRSDGRPFTHDAETLESFYYLTREIARRRLHKVFKNYLKTGVLPRGIG